MDTDGIISHTSPIVGRSTELAEIRRLLDSPECRMVTLLGPGGIGKTRLAAYAATSSPVSTRTAVTSSLGGAGMFSQSFIYIYVYLAETALMQGDPLTARDDAEKGLAVSQAAGVEAGKAISPAQLVLAHLALGDTGSACNCLRHDVDWGGPLEDTFSDGTLTWRRIRPRP